jgi:hypothetical protein
VGGQEDLLVEDLLFLGTVVMLFVVVLGIEVLRALVRRGFDRPHPFASFNDRDIIVRTRHSDSPSFFIKPLFSCPLSCGGHKKAGTHLRIPA